VREENEEINEKERKMRRKSKSQSTPVKIEDK
jgi:hypothetical protein